MDNNKLLIDLQQLLKHKKSKEYYSEKLNITKEYLEKLLEQLRNQESHDTLEDLEQLETSIKFDENLKNGTAEITANLEDKVENLEDLIKKCNIDTNKWDITRYVQNFWGSISNPHWQVKAWLSVKKEDNKFQEGFIDFLKSYKPACCKHIKKEKFIDKPKVTLILPKQDAHFNKYDINGYNDIESRFNAVSSSMWSMLKKATATNIIEEVVYIVGSDQFNSEWTLATTKGTSQQNILSYQESFKAICDHEISVIQDLIEFSEKVKIVFIPGNHDEYVGWHLIHFLETYFRNEDNVTFDSLLHNTKYHRYGNSAIMLNHGDAIKPKELAQKFPIGFNKEWSNCQYYYIFTGDKHHELSLDIQGIKFYQIPQLSKAVSKWDDKMGYIDNNAEMTAFVITKDKGMSDIYKDIQ